MRYVDGFVRRTAVVLALAAMMLRALMPAGWMPNPAGAGESLFGHNGAPAMKLARTAGRRAR